jgi:UDP-GlcNAc:undecaprenyl-phosphate GlcNAc-1-phosphate transferase
MINLFFFIFIINLLIFLNYSKIAKIYKVYDIPDNLRKHHRHPIPLLGGLIIYFNILILIVFSYFNFIENIIFRSSYEVNVFFISVSFFFIIGFLDDKYNISANKKLLIVSTSIYFIILLDNSTIITDLSFSFYNKKIFLKELSIPITILCFLLFTNAYNMLDGINCQAAFYTLFVAIIFIFNNVNNIFFTNLIITLLFFLWFNFKNKMFLGNSGSLLLSYIIGFFFIKSYNFNNTFYSDEIFLIMMIPGIELLRLAILRLLNKKHPFKADRNHIHHIILKKKSLFSTFLIIQVLLWSPFILFLLFKNFLIASLLSLLIYFATMYYYSFPKNYIKR